LQTYNSLRNRNWSFPAEMNLQRRIRLSEPKKRWDETPLAPVEAERNIKNVVAYNIKGAIILIELFTRSGINDYSI
jgi:hypothetical protein